MKIAAVQLAPAGPHRGDPTGAPEVSGPRAPVGIVSSGSQTIAGPDPSGPVVVWLSGEHDLA